MELSSELLSQFAKITKDDTKTPEVGVQVEGTARLYNGKIYVQLDGSDQLTPVISSTAGMKDGDRVTVTIKDHTAKVTGNVSSPSAGQGDIDDAKQEIGNKITEVEILIADKVSTKEFDAEKARIDNLVADNVVIKDKLTATDAEIKNLTADNVTINQNLTAQNAEIENLKATKLDVDIADIRYATVEKLEATDANVHNLTADYGEFKKLSTDKFAANEASIKKLETEKLSATDADLKYANIDFANIGKAAIENFFSKSGMIGDLVVGEGTITGTLVGVTIKGDLIEGGTVKADKLVIKGTDGLYYKLNTNGETVGAQQTDYNSLNGSIITAKSITAEKVNVNDLVAFGATIGGFHITDSAIYSGAKESINNTTRGTYMDDDGQFAIGDGSNYLKFFKDTDGKYKLDISAASIKFGASGETVENVVQDMVVKTDTEYYISTSPTSLAGGSWSTASPTWSAGKYIWTRNKSTKKSGKVEYSNAACTTGAPGKDGVGTPGAPGADGKTSYFHVKYSAVANPTTPDQMVETPSEYIGTYVDFTEADSTDPKKYTWSKFKGTDGTNGTPGKNGADGKTSYLHIAYANSADGTNGFSVSDSVGKLYIGQYTDFIEADSTDPKKYSWTKIKGSDGASGVGIKAITNYYLATSASSGVTTSTGGWTITIQTITPDKKYLWNYEKIEYTDAKVTQTTPCIIGTYGKDGAPGAPGTDGVGITSIVEYYQVSTSNTTAPTSWVTTPPAMTATNRYLWNYERIAYTNGSTTDTAKRVIGVYGDKGNTGNPGSPGKDGVGIKSSAVTYQASSSGTSIPTGSWVTTIPTVAAGQYLWTKTVIAYTDGKSTTSYSVGKMGQNGSNGAPGADGKPGADGIGIKSTAITYQAGASQTSAPTGTWSTSVPKLSAATPYLWTKTVITYTDGKTSTSYSVGSTLAGVEVGGRNLVQESGNFKSLGLWKANGSDSIDVSQEDDYGCIHAVGSIAQTTSRYLLEWNTRYVWHSVCKFARGGVLTPDIPQHHWICKTNDINSIGPSNGAVAEGGIAAYELDTGKSAPAISANTWYHIVYSFKTIIKPSDYKYVLFRPFFYGGSVSGSEGNGEYWVRWVKLEKGNKPTDWTPAPEDVQQGIDHAQIDATNANNKLEEQIPNIEFAKSQIEILNKSISSLVVDQNGGSLMTQTSDGWQFNIGAIQSALNGAIGDIQDVKGDISGVTDLANKTNQLANDVAKKTAYINMTQDESGQPVMELGQQNGEFRLRITNTSMDFMQGSQRIAYLSNRQLYIQSSVVTDEMKIGAGAGYIWKKRANGNMGLRYVTS